MRIALAGKQRNVFRRWPSDEAMRACKHSTVPAMSFPSFSGWSAPPFISGTQSSRSGAAMVYGPCSWPRAQPPRNGARGQKEVPPRQRSSEKGEAIAGNGLCLQNPKSPLARREPSQGCHLASSADPDLAHSAVGKRGLLDRSQCHDPLHQTSRSALFEQLSTALRGMSPFLF